MKKQKIGLLIALTVLSFSSFSQVKIIFDTDFGGDADDLGALAMLHNFMEKGECDLIAIACWSLEQNAVPAIEATNRFYKHPDIPIGSRKEGAYIDSASYSKPICMYNQDTIGVKIAYIDSASYSKPIADSFYHELNSKIVVDATILYREILAKSEDKSITVITVGPLKNIENLIKSQGDSISDLSGKELIKRKVKEFVIVGGQFPEGKKEWNFYGNMTGVTKFVIQNIDVPITFSGFEVGYGIKIGENFNKIDQKTPLYIGFKHFSQNAPWRKTYYKGKILDNSSFDQTAVLYAVRKGIGNYWDKIENGICVPDDIGGNKWIKSTNSNHSYLKLKMEKEKIAKLIESIMLGDF